MNDNKLNYKRIGLLRVNSIYCAFEDYYKESEQLIQQSFSNFHVVDNAVKELMYHYMNSNITNIVNGIIGERYIVDMLRENGANVFSLVANNVRHPSPMLITYEFHLPIYKMECILNEIKSNQFIEFDVMINGTYIVELKCVVNGFELSEKYIGQCIKYALHARKDFVTICLCDLSYGVQVYNVHLLWDHVRVEEDAFVVTNRCYSIKCVASLLEIADTYIENGTYTEEDIRILNGIIDAFRQDQFYINKRKF